MKLSVLHTKDDQYRFAVTVDGVHRTVAALPTLTEAMHMTLAELKAAVAQASTEITGTLAAPIFVLAMRVKKRAVFLMSISLFMKQTVPNSSLNPLQCERVAPTL
jgi:hypothetical protein